MMIAVILPVLSFALLTWRRAGVLKAKGKRRLEELGLEKHDDSN